MGEKADHDIVVIGASWGGVKSISRILSELPPDIPAAFFIVQHTSPSSPGELVRIFQNSTALTVKAARDSDTIAQGTVYVAIPDHHLLLHQGKVHVHYGPRENRWRPAIDTLFRSAAVTFGNRVIGVLLHGFLADGSSGLHAIKRCGGLVIVQQPEETDASSMVKIALRSTPVDTIVPLAGISSAITKAVYTPRPPLVEIPLELIKEVELIGPFPPTKTGNEPGEPVALTCPACGGPLREIADANDTAHYRCIVGHSFSSNVLLEEQRKNYEQALWAAIRMMEERSNLMHSGALREQNSGRDRSAGYYQERADEAHKNSLLLRKLLRANPPVK